MLKCVLWSDCTNPEEANKGKSTLSGARVKLPIAIRSKRTDQISMQGIYSSVAFSYHMKSHVVYWEKLINQKKKACKR